MLKRASPFVGVDEPERGVPGTEGVPPCDGSSSSTMKRTRRRCSYAKSYDQHWRYHKLRPDLALTCGNFGMSTKMRAVRLIANIHGLYSE